MRENKIHSELEFSTEYTFKATAEQAITHTLQAGY